MKSGIASATLVIIALVLLVLGYSSIFTVPQTRQALVVRLGDPIRIVEDAGLHFKMPFVDSVIYIDKRILDLENPQQEVIASDQKRLVVESFARYKVSDPLKFYQTVGSIDDANSRLSTLLNSAVRRVLGEATLVNFVRDERAKLMATVQQQLANESKSFGVEIIDVRIRRADLPEQNSQAVYQRMQTARQREAAEFRAQGNQKAQEIRAKADRDVTVIVADATSKAEQARGVGDAKRNQIFAEAYQRDKDFFQFYRSMQAYQNGLHANNTRLVLKPDSNFFRYFNNPFGKASAGGSPEGENQAPVAGASQTPAANPPAGSQ
ncbi:MAG TPA: protease modulator HflC [Xanthobacteraceae bacterium]|jgi:membrane protease subunit HflC|nr:protease modulator HflC [Xanthobacteraceae bacterium]